MRILVTGGAGFIGSNLAGALAGRGHDTVVVDDFSSGAWTNLVGFAGEVVTLDVAGAGAGEALKRLGAFEVIFHQASITDTTVTDQRRMMHNNVEGFRTVLDVAVGWGARVVWASSAAVYGRGPAPMKETQAPQPLNVYGYSKLAMERLARAYHARLSVVVGLRYFNVYGMGEAHKGKFASMIWQLACQMRAGKRPRIFVDGEQNRDFVYIGDVVEANLRAMEAKESGVFNVGFGAAASFNQVIAQLNRVLKTNLAPDYFENPYNFFQGWTEADVSAARKGLGYVPQFDLVRGIDEYAKQGLGAGV